MRCGLVLTMPTDHACVPHVSPTEALEAFLVGHKIDVYDVATGGSRSGRIERYDPRTDKHLVAFEPEEEEEEEEAGEEEEEEAAAKAEAEEGKAPAPAPALERKWITLRVRLVRGRGLCGWLPLDRPMAV